MVEVNGVVGTRIGEVKGVVEVNGCGWQGSRGGVIGVVRAKGVGGSRVNGVVEVKGIGVVRSRGGGSRVKG